MRLPSGSVLASASWSKMMTTSEDDDDDDDDSDEERRRFLLQPLWGGCCRSTVDIPVLCALCCRKLGHLTPQMLLSISRFPAGWFWSKSSTLVVHRHDVRRKEFARIILASAAGCGMRECENNMHFGTFGRLGNRPRPKASSPRHARQCTPEELSLVLWQWWPRHAVRLSRMCRHRPPNTRCRCRCRCRRAIGPGRRSC